MTQDLTEPELALEEAKDQETPLGPRHLHWVHRDGGGHWLVRGAKKSSLCGTIRCREVMILEPTVAGIGFRIGEEEDQEGVMAIKLITVGHVSVGSPVPQEGYREI